MNWIILFQAGIFMLVSILYLPTSVETSCTILPYPEKYLNCCLSLEGDNDEGKLTGEEINGFCLQTYLVTTPKERWDYDFDVKSGYNYIGKLMSDGFQYVLTHSNVTYTDDSDGNGYYNRVQYLGTDDYDNDVDNYFSDGGDSYRLVRKKRQTSWNRFNTANRFQGRFTGGSTNRFSGDSSRFRGRGRNNVGGRPPPRGPPPRSPLSDRVNTPYSGCTRREIRSLSSGELERFHSVIRRAREDTSLSPNVWGFYAQWHSGARISAVHGGPSFLPWHRVLLLCLERALQVYDRSFCLPYWDPMIEYRMNDPRNSILFTEEYLGSANGYITGRYGGLGINRNMMSANQREMLISPERLRRVYGESNPANVIYNQNLGRRSQPASVIEILHNDVHQYVGGIMDDLSRAAADPLFWLHHSNIDRIWENYRIRHGINYPFGTGDHARDTIMPQFGDIASLSWLNGGDRMRNVHGISARWRDFVRYAPPPTTCRGGSCERQNFGGGSDSRERGGLGRSGTSDSRSSSGWSTGSTSGWTRGGTRGRTSGSVGGSGWSRGMTRGRLNRVPSGRTSGTGWTNRMPSGRTSARGRSGVWGRKKRSVSSYRNFETDYGDPAIQHSFYIDGRRDADQWVYVPVPITFTRPEGLHFNSYAVKNGSIKYGHDIFDTYLYSSLKKCIKMGHQKPFKTCKASGSGKLKVFVVTTGKNYNGKFKEYALVDERFPISKSIAYVAIKKPSSRPSEVFFTAYDECGRTCKPMCLEEGSSPPVYKRCSGILKIDNKEPKMYGDTIADAVLKHWNFPKPSTHIAPNTNGATYCIMFLCDSSIKYPWNRQEYGDY